MIHIKASKISGLFAASLLLFCLLSCQQLRLSEVGDYSSLLPPDQLLYLSFQRVGDFPYRELSARFIGEDKWLQGFVAQRLQRSQLAIGPASQLYAINQLALQQNFFARQMAKQVKQPASGWQKVAELPAAYWRGSSNGTEQPTYQALQMPQNNLLYLSQGAQLETSKALEEIIQTEQREFARAQRQNERRTELPRRFRQLVAEQLPAQIPLVAYSQQAISLIVSPWLQKTFPRALGSFAKVSRSFPVGGLLAWLEITDKQKYGLHLQLSTGSLILSKGLEAGFRLFLPSLLGRSKQAFIRSQLPNVKLQSTEEFFYMQMPLDQDSLVQMLGALKF